MKPFIKTAKAYLKKDKINGKYGTFDAYTIQGDSPSDTIKIKDTLKSIGFQWFGAKSLWWIAANKLTDLSKQRLTNMGVVDLSRQQTEQPESTIKTPEPPQKPTTEIPKNDEPKQWITENEEMSRWYGFPMNANIETYSFDVSINDNPYKCTARIERTYQKGKESDSYRETKSKEYRGLPKYKFHFSIPEIKTKEPTTASIQCKEKWGTYNEKEKIEEYKKVIATSFQEKKSKAYVAFAIAEDVAKRTPEYRQFLQDIRDKKHTITYPVTIEDPEYGGTYELKVDWLIEQDAMKATLTTNVKDSAAPRDATIEYSGVNIYKTYTIEDFNNKMKEYIERKKQLIQNTYIAYLKSFPFLESQKNEQKQKSNLIIEMIENPSEGQAEGVLRELQNRGYIRPHKRQKQTSGLSSGEEIKWVVDSKKIVNDAYNGNASLINNTEYFYAVMAYYVHRKVRGIWSWTDMMLTDSIREWIDTVRRLGFSINFNQVLNAIETIGNAIVTKIYAGKTKEQRNKEFFEDFYGDGTTSEPSQNPALQELANFAQQFGVDPQGIEDNLRNIYRALAKQLHPDMYPDPKKKSEMEQKFKELQIIWNKIPDQYKQAFSWYELYKFANC